MQTATLPRAEIQAIFARHYGSATKLARELGISHVSISLWLHGRANSARVEEAVTKRAFELLREESASDPGREAAKKLLARMIEEGTRENSSGPKIPELGRKEPAQRQKGISQAV